MRKLDHCNIVRLRYFFYSSGEKVSRVWGVLHLDSTCFLACLSLTANPSVMIAHGPSLLLPCSSLTVPYTCLDLCRKTSFT